MNTIIQDLSWKFPEDCKLAELSLVFDITLAVRHIEEYVGKKCDVDAAGIKEAYLDFLDAQKVIEQSQSTFRTDHAIIGLGFDHQRGVVVFLTISTVKTEDSCFSRDVRFDSLYFTGYHPANRNDAKWKPNGIYRDIPTDNINPIPLDLLAWSGYSSFPFH